MKGIPDDTNSKKIPNKSCIADTLELIGLSNAGKKRVANFSLGMKQRLALGVALLGEPEFLILDEPVNGLDPTGIIELRELLKKLVKERETTILISSHILSELHQLATCYGFLHKGELLKQISAEKLNEECKRYICLKTDNIQKSRLKFFIAKYIVITVTSIILYFSFIMVAFIIECTKYNVPIQLLPMLKIAGLNCMVMGAFIGITFMLCVIFKHTAIVVGTMSLFTFSGPLIYMMTWDNMSAQSWRVLTYLKINPMYYWMNTCSYNMVNHLEINILLYFVGTVIITFLVSALILRKQEIH